MGASCFLLLLGGSIFVLHTFRHAHSGDIVKFGAVVIAVFASIKFSEGSISGNPFQLTQDLPESTGCRRLHILPSVQDDSRLVPDASAVIIERWTREFKAYRERIEQAGHDLWMDLSSRLARIGIHPFISREDIDDRRA